MGTSKDCSCDELVASPSVLSETEECGTCGGLNVYWSMENFYRSVLRNKITQTQLPPFTVNVNKLPYSKRGLMTLSPNQDTEEVVEYSYTNGNPGDSGEITIMKRGIHPAALNLVLDGLGGNESIINIDSVDTIVAPEYNNCDYMFEHLTNSDVQRDITAQDFNIFSRHTCCIPATARSLGIVALTKEPDNPEFPIAVGANDFTNCDKNSGILRGLTKCVPDGEEIAVSWNDYATHSRAGLVTIKDIESESVACGAGTISTNIHNGTVVERALHAEQRAFKSVYGTVKLSNSNSDSIALSASEYAGNLNDGIVKIKVANSNPTCSIQAGDDNQDCPTFAKEVVQKNDMANTTQSGLVLMSQPLNTNHPCPIAVSKHDYATIDNTGIVRVQDYCPVGDGYPIVPSMCTYADNNQLGLTFMSVANDTCGVTNYDKPTVSAPIATSTDDKRNFRQMTKFERNFTANGAGPGLLFEAGNIDDPWDVIFNGGGYPGTGFVITNTGPVAGGEGTINNGDFYCYEKMHEDTGTFEHIDITQSGLYTVSWILKVRNTESQLASLPDTTTTTVTYSGRSKINGNKLESGTLSTMMTITGDPTFNVIDPRYGEGIRTTILNSSSSYYFAAGDEISLSLSFDQIEVYLLYAEIVVTCIQPDLT